MYVYTCIYIYIQNGTHCLPLLHNPSERTRLPWKPSEALAGGALAADEPLASLLVGDSRFRV